MAWACCTFDQQKAHCMFILASVNIRAEFSRVSALWVISKSTRKVAKKQSLLSKKSCVRNIASGCVSFTVLYFSYLPNTMNISPFSVTERVCRCLTDHYPNILVLLWYLLFSLSNNKTFCDHHWTIKTFYDRHWSPKHLVWMKASCKKSSSKNNFSTSFPEDLTHCNVLPVSGLGSVQDTISWVILRTQKYV